MTEYVLRVGDYVRWDCPDDCISKDHLTVTCIQINELALAATAMTIATT